MNIVHIGGELVNNAVTSKEALLKAAKTIAYEEGLEKLNIRRLAGVCKISVGAVYNYFPAKSDLIFELIKDFWNHIDSGNMPICPDDGRFADYFEEFYSYLFLRLKEFRSGFLKQISSLSQPEKQAGRAIENICWEHMKSCLLVALKRDFKINSAIWTSGFTQEKFINFVFANMMTMLRTGEENCIFLKEIIIRILY